MIEITGQKEVNQNIDKYINIVSTNTTEGLKEIGERGVKYLKTECGVFENPTGRLRGSMSYTIDGKVNKPIWDSRVNKSGDAVNKTSDKEAVYIGTNVIYGPYVEYLAKNGSAGYMYRAWKATKKVAEQILATTIRSKVR